LSVLYILFGRRIQKKIPCAALTIEINVVTRMKNKKRERGLEADAACLPAHLPAVEQTAVDFKSFAAA
jgi:hypothetical protein